MRNFQQNPTSWVLLVFHLCSQISTKELAKLHSLGYTAAMRALRVSALIFLALGLSSCFLIPMDEAVYGLTTTGEGKLPEESWSNVDYSKFAGETLWFYQDVKAGVPYDIRFADATDGSGVLNGAALDIKVTAYAADKTTVVMSEMDKGYAEDIGSIHRYKPSTDMRLYLKVEPANSAATSGQFWIRCTPLMLLKDNSPISDTLTDSEYFTGNWYYYKNTSATTVNLRVTFPATGYSEATCTMMYGEGSNLQAGSWNSFPYNSPNLRSIDVVPNSTFYFHVLPFSWFSSDLGGYSIEVSAGSATNLNHGTMDSWIDGEITASAPKAVYEYDTIVGDLYQVNWNDGLQGDGTKTSRCQVKAGTSMPNDYFDGAFYGYSTSRVESAVGTKLYVTLAPSYDSSDFGTFAVRVAHLAATTLASGTWTAGTITSSSARCFFAFPTTVGASYTVYWDDKFQGSNSGLTSSVYTQVIAQPANGTDSYYFGSSNYGFTYGYSTGQTFTATSSVAVVQVWSYTGETGNFKVKAVSN